MGKELPVNLATAVTICETLEGLLRDSIGPNALHTMLTSPSGRVVITGDGLTILTSLHLSHPIARWIVERVKGHHGVTGDNSKSFVLIVAEILRRLRDAISLKSQSSDSCCKQDLIEVSRALETVNSEIFPEVVLPELLRQCLCFDLVKDQRDEVATMSRKIVGSALNGMMTAQARDFVAELIVDLVCSSSRDVGNLAETVEELISDYDVICLEVPNKPVSKSKVLDGIVLTRNFAFQLEELDSLTVVPFVIISCFLDKWTPDVRSTLAADCTHDLTTLLRLGASRAQSLIEHLKDCGVKLLLSSELLSDATLSFCRAAGISAVHMIPEEELSRLARLTKTDIIYDALDIVKSLKLGRAKFCGTTTVGGSIGVHLGFSDERVWAKQLVLCAPTQGICRQWFMSVLNALKSLRMWLDTGFLDEAPVRGKRDISETSSASSHHMTERCETIQTSNLSSSRALGLVSQDSTRAPDGAHPLESDPSPANNGHHQSEICKPKGICIPGGGCTEFLIHRIFYTLTGGSVRQDITTPQKWEPDADGNPNLKDPPLHTAASILRDAALCIPRTLHKNSFSPKSQKSAFLEIVSRVRDCSTVIGLNGRTGAVCDHSEVGTWEPLSSRYKLWRDAIQTVQGLLRIDMIVGVKVGPEDHHSNTEDEDSDGT